MNNRQIQIILESIDEKLDLVIKSQASLGLLLDCCIKQMHEKTCKSREAFLASHPGITDKLLHKIPREKDHYADSAGTGKYLVKL